MTPEHKARLIKEIKEIIEESENSAEEYIQDTDNPEEGEYYLAKAYFLKKVIIDLESESSLETN